MGTSVLRRGTYAGMVPLMGEDSDAGFVSTGVDDAATDWNGTSGGKIGRLPRFSTDTKVNADGFPEMDGLAMGTIGPGSGVELPVENVGVTVGLWMGGDGLHRGGRGGATLGSLLISLILLSNTSRCLC